MTNLGDVVNALKHLPGKHQQKSHGGKGGGRGKSGGSVSGSDHPVVKNALSFNDGKKAKKSSFSNLNSRIKKESRDSGVDVKDISASFSSDKVASLLGTKKSNLVTIDAESAGFGNLVGGLVKNSSSLKSSKNEEGWGEIVKGTTNDGVSYVLNNIDDFGGLIVDKNNVGGLLGNSD